MTRVTLYTKENCSLCDEVKADLASLQDEIPHELIEIDIHSEPALLQEYADQIPVLKIGPYTLKAPVSRTDLSVALLAARDGEAGPRAPTDATRKYNVGLHKAVYFFARHWLAIFNLVIFIYLALPFTAPVLMRAGAQQPAKMIYTLYSPLCHQLAFRSWFVFGEEAAYPLEESRAFETTYTDLTGSDEVDFSAASRYVGDETAGYKVALCQRDVAIYGGILAAGLLFALVRSWLPAAPILLWVLIGILPMALDGISQLVSYFPLIDLPTRESTPVLRTMTGLLFGVMNVWLAYPHVEEAMKETQVLTAGKLIAAGEMGGTVDDARDP